MKRGFTLIEVLVSAAILILVSLAVVAVGNSISQTTVLSSDTTVASYQAQQNLNLISNLRDTTVATLPNGNNGSNEGVWFEPATNQPPDVYGWYVMIDDPQTGNWSVSPVSASIIPGGSPNDPAISDLIKGLAAVGSTTQNTVTTNTTSSPNTYQVICIEPYAADDTVGNVQTNIPCDTTNGTSNLDDGSRSLPISNADSTNKTCDANDSYCNDTFSSLNNDGSTTSSTNFFIPPGNAVKIKSVVIWQTQSSSALANYKYTAISSLLTNWETPGSLNEQSFGN